MSEATARVPGAAGGAHARRGGSFTLRLSVALALLLLGYGGLVTALGRHVAQQQEAETLQRLSHGLARHIVEHFPQIARDDDSADADGADRRAREELLAMLMVVNPGVQVYLLAADGTVRHYLGEPGMVRERRVDLGPVRAFLAGAALPVRSTDPMGSGVPLLFSAAAFPPRTAPGAGGAEAPASGFLYVVLDGAARSQVAATVSPRRLLAGEAAGALVALLLTFGVGVFTFRRQTQPLHRLAQRIHGFELGAGSAAATDRDHRDRPQAPLPQAVGDEVAAIGAAFDALTMRLAAQAERERQQTREHRERMLGIAHDLRTPLTALHGQLEALAANAGPALDPALDPDRNAVADRVSGPGQEARQRLLEAALAQSERVGRLSQQLFELAALQAIDQVPHRERFRLDDLVNDTVQKFALLRQPPGVVLEGPAPQPLEMEGDPRLVERALSNLIENALRHSGNAAPVQVVLRDDASDRRRAEIVVADRGPGLPDEVLRRLQAGESPRDAAASRAGRAGGIGGLGLAIAQQVALLHGGELVPLPTDPEDGGGARLKLALPVLR